MENLTMEEKINALYATNQKLNALIVRVEEILESVNAETVTKVSPMIKMIMSMNGLKV